MQSAAPIPESITCIPADLTDKVHREALVARVTATGQLDGVIHCAGQYSRGTLAQAPVAELSRQWEINVAAPYALTQALLPTLTTAGGHIIFLNSTQGLRATGGVGQYASTKHALRALADSLREELSGSGVKVCTVFLGRTATSMQRQVFVAEGRSWQEDALLAPEDVANVVGVILATSDRAEITEITVRPARPLSR